MKHDYSAIEGIDRFGRHNVATFQFDMIQELQLEGFNQQNVLMNLSIEALVPPQNGARFIVSLQPAFGVGGNFNCQAIRLKSISPGPPAGTVYG